MRCLLFKMMITLLIILCATTPVLAAESAIKSMEGDNWENLTVGDSGFAVLAYNDNSTDGIPGTSQSGWINSMYQKPANPNPVRPDRPNITNNSEDLDALFGSGAQLIWESNPVKNPTTGDIVKFTKTFDMGDVIIGSDGEKEGQTKIYISVDNAFIAFLNEKYVGCSDRSLQKTDWSDLNNDDALDSAIVGQLGDMGDSVIYSTSHVRVYSFDIPADYFNRGETNTLAIYACNKRVDVSQGDFSWDGEDGNYNSNPAFIMYSMPVNSSALPYIDLSKEWADHTGTKLSDQNTDLTATLRVLDQSDNPADLSTSTLTGDLTLATDGKDGLVEISGNGGGRIIMDDIVGLRVEEISSNTGYIFSGGYNGLTETWEFVNTIPDAIDPNTDVRAEPPNLRRSIGGGTKNTSGSELLEMPDVPPPLSSGNILTEIPDAEVPLTGRINDMIPNMLVALSLIAAGTVLIIKKDA